MKEKKLNSLVSDWQKYCNRNYTSATCELYNIVLAQFLKFLKKRPITPESIESFIDFRLESGISKLAVNTNIIAIKSFCRWNMTHNNAENYAKNITQIKLAYKEARIISQSEYEVLLEVSLPHEKDIIEFIANTGLRASEFNSLTWANISNDRKYLSIIGKGRKHRIIPLNNTTRTILDKYKPNGGKLQFVKNNRCALIYLCNKLRDKANIPSFGVHALRHYFATTLYKKGVSVQHISRLLGHSSVVITEKIYIHFIPQDLLGLTDCLEN